MKYVLMIFAAATVTTAAVNGELTAAGTGSCESLASLTLPGTTITFAKAVDAGEFTPPVPVGATAPRPAAVQAFRSLPAFCRVAAALKPASFRASAMEDGQARFPIPRSPRRWPPVMPPQAPTPVTSATPRPSRSAIPKSSSTWAIEPFTR